ncbi:uncharacterized MFS-type transporter C09D4.1-like [Nylanderia fulva]|uniref:uncharacterized MFS-type transporter C09D4.1-like n=1 Tax=Nylanderia fulva TaxID=613905 RepID=UPI0010FB970B|nr:uncharacterized MFS-type transporter C09D4.1-like [Nylanderia fulva]
MESEQTQVSEKMGKASGDYIKTIEGDMQPSQGVQIKIYKKRWLMLVLFVLYSASNGMQWIQYSIIANIVMRYYNVSSFLIDMTSMIYMITYIPLIFPASYLLNKFGLRYAMIFGALGTALGSWIKVFSIATDRFWITFLGQSLVAVSQIFVLSVPARLAALWFGPDQVSSACSIGVFANLLGVAIGFVFPPMLVPNSDNICNVERGLQLMFYIVAAFTTLILVFILFFFKAAPPLPPSPAQAVQRENTVNEKFSHSIKRLLTNTGYVLLLFSFGINSGVLSAISTFLNQIILKHFQGHEEDAGRIGLTIVCIGVLSSVICGVILDKTHKFKETTLVIYLCCLLGMIVFTLTLDSKKIYVVYITAGILGFFITGYLPVGFEFAVELTYPEPEDTSTGLLNAMVQVFSIAFTMLYGFLFNNLDDLMANVAMCIVLGIGTLLTIMIPNNLRRQNVKV